MRTTGGIDARIQVSGAPGWRDAPPGMNIGAKGEHYLSLATNAHTHLTIRADGKIGIGKTVQCKVDADIASIKFGDLLTTGPTNGQAQKVIDPSRVAGSIIGKALGSLKKGKGKIPALVMLQ